MGRLWALVRNAQASIRIGRAGEHADLHRATAFREYCRPGPHLQWRRERVKLRRSIRDFSNKERASSLV
jgi:hypothetical protein